MKNLLLILITVFVFSGASYSQNDQGYIGMTIGPSIPLGDLSSKDIDNEAAGFANTGAVFDISFAHKLGGGNFGIAALLRGQANPIDVQALADEYANEFLGVNWTVESDAWSFGGLMVGG